MTLPLPSPDNPPAEPPPLGVFLHSLRERRRLTIPVLARNTGLAALTIRRWEQGRTVPQVPNMECLLKALRASPSERLQALTLMPTRRVAAALRQSPPEDTGGAQRPELVAPRPFAVAVSQRAAPRIADKPVAGVLPLAFLPTTGDLWRALRRRQRLTVRKVAKHLRVHHSRVSRWEEAGAPPPERVGELLDLLGAYPEERTALRGGLLLAGPPEHRVGTLDEAEHRIDVLGDLVNQGDPLPLDLSYLLLESQLWHLAQAQPAALRFLALTYTWHCGWLGGRGRGDEIGPFNAAALELIQAQRGPSEHFWTGAINQAAGWVRHRDKRQGAQRASVILQRWMPALNQPMHQIGALRDRADIEAQKGDEFVAFGLIRDATRLAQRVEDATQLRLCHVIHGRLLVNGGRAREALTLLPQDTDPSADLQMLEAILWADALLAVGSRAEAAAWLERFYALVERCDLPQRRQEGDERARHL